MIIGEKMNLKEELKHSDEMIAEAEDIGECAELFKGKLGNSEDVEDYLWNTLTFSNELASSTENVTVT